MPGYKLTMLPDAPLRTLQEGRTAPALSLYVTMDERHWITAPPRGSSRCRLQLTCGTTCWTALPEAFF
jgi:hypothetical protein